MAYIKTPDGGFYLDDSQFNVNYQTNVISLKGGTGGAYLPLAGGIMNPNAIISGDNSLEINLTNDNNNAIIEVSTNGVELRSDTTVVSIDNTGVDFGGSILKEVANPTNETDGANKQYVDSKIPVLATVSNAGIVKQIPNIEQFQNPSSATAQEIADKFNNLIQNLINAGIMVAGT